MELSQLQDLMHRDHEEVQKVEDGDKIPDPAEDTKYVEMVTDIFSEWSDGELESLAVAIAGIYFQRSPIQATMLAQSLNRHFSHHLQEGLVSILLGNRKGSHGKQE